VPILNTNLFKATDDFELTAETLDKCSCVNDIVKH